MSLLLNSTKMVYTVVTTDAKSGVVLMHAYMNEEALKKTIATKEAHYYSRSRNVYGIKVRLVD